MKLAYTFCLDGLTIQAQKNLETLLQSLGVFCFANNSKLNVSCTKCEKIMVEDVVNAALTLRKLTK